MKVKEEDQKVGLKLNIQKPKIIVFGAITFDTQIGKQWKQQQTLCGGGAPKSLQIMTAVMNLKGIKFLLWKQSYDQPRQHIKMQRHYFAKKCPSSQSYRFSSSHVWM